GRLRGSTMYVCVCRKVSDHQIKKAVDDGACTVMHLRRELGVAEQCGRCAQCAKAVIQEHMEARRSADMDDAFMVGMATA
ncbi:MAG: (2Fe-2S)-binding protein, partial [Gammaproteobacteria bacterium]